jgi:hypothetical protein
MSLKEELAELEREEEIDDGEEARLNAMQEDIYRLHRRIAVVVEYIDKGKPKEEPLTEEEMWELGFDAGFEEGEKHAMKTANEPAKEESTRHSEYAKGYEDGVRALPEKMMDPDNYTMDILEAIEAALAIKMPRSNLRTFIEVLRMQNWTKQGEADNAKEPEKSSGFGKKVGDV